MNNLYKVRSLRGKAKIVLKRKCSEVFNSTSISTHRDGFITKMSEVV